ncbi:MAG: LPS export ABC transporter permease LptG [Pseudomonadota bacterium]
MTLAPAMLRRRLSWILSAYIARQFLFWLGTFFFSLLGIILLITLVDLLDKSSNKQVSFGIVVQLALMKLPFLAQEVMPFTILFAGMMTFWRLTRSNELVVVRAAGISVWQFLLPVLSMGVLVGVLTVGVLNPLASALFSRFELLDARLSERKNSVLAVSDKGIWIRQADEVGQTVIHAGRVSSRALILYHVIVFQFGEGDQFLGRIDARRARLEKGNWVLNDAWVTVPGEQSVFEETTRLPTNLTTSKIQESFARPETISVWSLPSFIALLENAGFSALKHKLRLHRLLAVPLLFTAMLLLAATFSMRPQRRGRVATIILAGVLTGFLLHFLSNFVFALGLSAKIPVILAAWTPAGICMMLGIAMLLQLEDG